MEHSGFMSIRPTDDSDDSDVDDFMSSLIFVRGISLRKVEMCEYHELSEFYLVDMNKCRNGQVLKPFCDPLINTTSIGSIVHLRSNIYLSTLRLKQNQNQNQNPIIDIDNDKQVYHRLTGLSFINLSDQGKQTQWNLAPAPIDLHSSALYYVVLNRDIYCLPSYRLSEAHVYDPFLDDWFYTPHFPPRHLSNCCISKKLIPDPTHNRILVHLFDGDLPKPSLYAWYPEGRGDDGPIWDFITHFSTRTWRKKVILAGDVLFFYFRKTTDLFQAFDLKTKKVLNIKWCQYYPGNVARARAVSMSFTGGTQLTLHCYKRFISDIDNTITGCIIYLIRYHFERVSMDTLVFSYDLHKQFKLLNIRNVTHFISL